MGAERVRERETEGKKDIDTDEPACEQV